MADGQREAGVALPLLNPAHLAIAHWSPRSLSLSLTARASQRNIVPEHDGVGRRSRVAARAAARVRHGHHRHRPLSRHHLHQSLLFAPVATASGALPTGQHPSRPSRRRRPTLASYRWWILPGWPRAKQGKVELARGTAVAPWPLAQLEARASNPARRRRRTAASMAAQVSISSSSPFYS
jgi:hypothetical protein